jgi:ribosomal protein S18 acetylase RimI-like enzyme
MTIEVREAKPQEYDAAGRVTADAYREFVSPGHEAWEGYLRRIADVGERARRTVIVVAVEDARVLGSATLELDGRTEQEDEPLPPTEAHIRMLGVDRNARGRGVGSLLMRACEDRALAEGHTLMTLNTTPRMEAAQHMYASLGYVRREDRVFPDGFVLLTFAKDLSG